MEESVASQILSAGQPLTVETFGQESQAAAVPSETQIEAEPETKQDPKQTESKFDIIAKMERRIRREREELDQKRKEWDQSSKKYKDLEALDSTWEKNPLEFMEKKGWDFERLNKFIMENGDQRHLDPMAKKLFEYEQKFKDLETSTEKKIREAIESKEQSMQIERFKGNVKDFISTNKDNFELIHSEGDEGNALVFDLIQTDIINQMKEGKKDGQLKIMEIKYACERVEKYLDSQLDKYLSLNKVKTKFGQKLPEQAKKQVTISDDFAARTNSQQMSEQDRVKQAIELVSRGALGT